jgi:hypothetical protein
MTASIEPSSKTWKEVEAWANKEIENAQRQLEEPGLPHAETEGQRQRIATLRQLPALAETDNPPVLPTTEYT